MERKRECESNRGWRGMTFLLGLEEVEVQEETGSRKRKETG